jgi:MFS family permease
MVTTAMVFAIRGDIGPAMATSFHLTNHQLGLIFSPAFWCFTVAIYFSGAIVDLVGMRALHIASALGYFLGVALIVLAPRPAGHVASLFDYKGTAVLYAASWFLALPKGSLRALSVHSLPHCTATKKCVA